VRASTSSESDAVVATYHCELAWLGGERVAADVVIDVVGERIASVRPDVTGPIAGAVRLAGLTLPGFANAHSHAFHRALRSRTQHGQGSFWTWRKQMYEVAATLDPDRYFGLARATYGEMALAGISAVGEFHYLHHGAGGRPYSSPNAMADALTAAAAEAGIRITVLDACYLRGGPGVDLDPVQLRYSDGTADGWAARVSELSGAPGVRVGAAVHSVRAVDPPSIAVVAAWARAHRAPLHAHVSEQPAENEQVLAAHGTTPVGVLAASGAIDERFTAVHATHVTADDIGVLGARRCSCCACPTTERDLADGIGPTVALREAGCRLTLGSDSHAVIDLLEEARAVELDERLASLTRGRHDPTALLRMATADGHASIGWPEAGRIESGALADLTTIGFDSVRIAGTTPDDALASAVFAATAADVRHVVIGGRVVVRDSRHVTMDVATALREVLA
jgi:formiminoglutamate deiminase